MNTTELRAAISLAMIYVLRMLGLFMVMPVLAILAQDYPDYSVMLVGLAIGGYGLTQAILQIPMGVLSDKFGRKPIIAFGLLTFALGSFVAAMADSLWMLVVGRLLQGTGAIAGAIMALAADVSRENQRAKVMAIIGIAIGFSFYLALFLGPFIAKDWGLSGIFYATGALALGCIAVVFWLVPSATVMTPSGDTLPSIQDVKSLFFDPQISRLNVSVCLLHLMITLFFMQLPILLSSFDLALDVHWQLYLPVLLGSIIGLIVLMGLNRKLTKKTLVYIATALLAAACVGMSWSGSVLWLAIFATVFFTGFNYLEANLPAWVSAMAPAGKKGSAMGIYASFQFFGAFAGGVLAGLLNQTLEPSQVLLVVLLIVVLWWLTLYRLNLTDRYRRYTFANLQHLSEPQNACEQLRALPGVVELVFVDKDQAIYLKADANFDFRQAQSLVTSQSAG